MSVHTRTSFLPISLLLAIAAVSLVACARKPEVKTIPLPPTPALAPQETWGVVTSERLRLREGPSVNSPAVITLFKGYVVEVVRRSQKAETVGDLTNHWYYINFKGLRGWVYGYYLTMYDSQQRAEQAAKELP